MSVSVIIPYYNHGKFLQSAVQSSLAAFDGACEILIINDGSKERHAAVYLRNVQKLSSAVKVIEKHNGGLSSARNTGLELAQGEYIQFLDSDDILIPRKIDYQIAQLKNIRSAAVSVTSYATCDAYAGNLQDGSYSIIPYKFDARAFLFSWERGLSIPIHCGLFRREIFDELRFDENVYGKEDWIFWCNLISRFPDSIVYCPMNGALYRMHGSGMTRSPALMGESWVQATDIISRMFPEHSEEFKKAAMEWHKVSYSGARMNISLPHKQTVTIDSGHSLVAQHPNSSRLGKENYTLVYDNKIDLEPLISVIIPVYNQAKYLNKCFKSVFKQTKRNNIELIIVDDASPDPEVAKILAEVSSDQMPVKIFRNTVNRGISETQNLAVKLATGQYIAFLDCDDCLAPEAMAHVSGKIAESRADYYFSDKIDISENDKPVRNSKYGGYGWIAYSGDIKNDLTLGMIASHLKVIKKESYLAIGGSNNEYSGIQDWKLALDLSINGTFVYINEYLYYHRVHENSVTNSSSMMQFYLTNKLRREHLARITSSSQTGGKVIINSFQSPEEVRILTKLKLQGSSLVFDSEKRTLSQSEINLLREFNSFFDHIKLSASECAALMGYLWSERSVIVQAQ